MQRSRSWFGPPAAMFMLLTACGDEAVDETISPNEPATEAPATREAAASSGTSTPGPAAPTRPRRKAVAFMHGTSDRGTVADLRCSGTGDDWHCATETAEDAGDGNSLDYWTQETIDSERTRPDGTRRPFIAVGCPQSAYAPWPNPKPVLPKNGPAEPGSAECVAAEIVKFLDGPDGKAGTDDDIDDIAIVTHSGGGNVIRYLLQQYSARPEFARVRTATRGVLALAAPFRGEYLSDVVFGGGLLSLANGLLDFGYDDDGIAFTRRAEMARSNADPAKLVDLSKDQAGVPFYVGGGVYPDVYGPEELVACGGKAEEVGLNLLHSLYLDVNDPATGRTKCSDGMVSCEGSMALANGDPSRVVFGRLDGKDIGTTRFRGHHQTRRSCNGVDLDVRATFDKILADAPARPNAMLLRERARYAPGVRLSAGVEKGAIVRAAAVRHDANVVLQLTARVAKGSRIGVRATLVAEESGESWVVSSSQQALDRTAPAPLAFTLSLPAPATSGRLVVRDVALVSHDDATLLDAVDEVAVRR